MEERERKEEKRDSKTNEKKGTREKHLTLEINFWLRPWGMSHPMARRNSWSFLASLYKRYCLLAHDRLVYCWANGLEYENNGLECEYFQKVP